MKKIIILIIISLLSFPVMIFAGDGISIGVTGMYDSGMTLDQFEGMTGLPEISVDEILYGAEVRIDLSLLQVSTNAVYYDEIGALIGLADAGIYVDLGFLGLGVGGGVNYLTDFSDFTVYGYNAKVAADVRLGSLILSGFLFGIPVDDGGSALLDLSTVDGPEDILVAAGVSALIQL